MPSHLMLPLSYLNYFDGGKTHISEQIGSVIDEILAPDVDPTRLPSLIERVIIFSQRSIDHLEYPEVLLPCAVALIRKGKFQAARDYIVLARTIYNDRRDTFREAIAYWMQWFTEHELDEHVYARNCLTEAINALQGLIDENKVFIAHQSKNEMEEEYRRELNIWYQKRIDEIRFDLSVSPYEMFTWLNPFSDLASKLSPWSEHLRKKIAGYLLTKEYWKIRPHLKEMRQTAESRNDFEELPEIYTFTAIVAYQIDELVTAQLDLNKAVEFFPHRRHKQAVARWIKGITFWKQDAISKAIREWSRVASDFKQLYTEAQQKNDGFKMDWYREKLRLIETVIARDISAR